MQNAILRIGVYPYLCYKQNRYQNTYQKTLSSTFVCNCQTTGQTLADALLLKIINNNFAKTVACKIHRIANTIFPVHLLLDMYIFSV